MPNIEECHFALRTPAHPRLRLFRPEHSLEATAAHVQAERKRSLLPLDWLNLREQAFSTRAAPQRSPRFALSACLLCSCARTQFLSGYCRPGFAPAREARLQTGHRRSHFPNNKVALDGPLRYGEISPNPNPCPSFSLCRKD